MKIKIDEFRIDSAQPAEAPLDFSTLCALLAAHQAATATARLARGNRGTVEQPDNAHPAIAILLAEPGQEAPGSGNRGSFHAGAAARFKSKTR